MIKNLKRNDIQVTPFVATKNWELSNTQNAAVLLLEQTASDGSDLSLAVEYIDYGDGTLPVTNSLFSLALEQQSLDAVIYQEGISGSGLFTPDNEPINLDGTYKRLVYSTIRNMFYNKHNDPTKIFGLEYIDLQSTNTKKFISEKIRSFQIPRLNFGDKVLEESVKLFDNSLDNVYTITDDGYENLVAGYNLFSRVQEIGEFANSMSIGFNGYCDSYVNPQAPSAPTNLSGSLTGSVTSSILFTHVSGAVLLGWSDNSSDELGFNLYGSSGSISGSPGTSPFVLVTTTAANVVSYLDKSTNDSMSYSYYVTAVGSSGESTGSNIATIWVTGSHVVIGGTGSLFDPSGSLYISGPYDTFEAYSLASTPSNGPFGWDGGWASSSFGFLSVTAEDSVESYSSGSDIAGLNGGSGWAGAWLESTPTAPTSLTASRTLLTSSLVWIDNSSNEDGFYIERSTNSGSSWSVLTSSAANVSSSTDITIIGGNTYWYRVQSYNTSGTSSYSNTASVFVNYPTAPTSLTSSTDGVKVSLVWTDNSNDEAGFNISRSIDSGSTWSGLATSSANTASYTDQNVSTGSTYWYQVQSFNQVGTSSYSNTSSVFIPIPLTLLALSESVVNFPQIGTLPANYGLGQAYVRNNKVYIFGGYNGVSLQNTVWTSSTNFATIVNVAGKTLPGPLARTVLFEVGDNLYLCGGQSTTVTSSIFSASVNDPTTWVHAGSLPIGVYGAQGFSTNDNLYIVGGFNGTNNSRQILTASKSTPTVWTSISMSLAGGGSAGGVYLGTSFVIGNTIYVYGGLMPTAAVVNPYVLTASVSNPLLWGTGSTGHSRKDEARGFIVGNYVYLLGGWGGSNPQTIIWRAPISPASASCGIVDTGKDLTDANMGSSVVISGSDVFIYGGDRSGGTFANNRIYSASIQNFGPTGSAFTSDVTSSNYPWLVAANY